MHAPDRYSVAPSASDEAPVVMAIRIACIALLAYWSLILVRPFLVIIVWAIIIAVAIYPIFDWLAARLLGHRVLAAIVVSVVGFLVILGPVTWLGLSLADSVRKIVTGFFDGRIAIPLPPGGVKNWPLIGEKVYETWLLASTNLRELLSRTTPQLAPYGKDLLGAAGGIGIDVLKFIVAAAISGFLLVPGPSLVQSTKNFLRHLTVARGAEFVDLAGATIRNVSRGVIGVAALQTLLAGLGMLFIGTPAAGLFSLLILLLGIIQIGPAIIIVPLIAWSWFTMSTVMALVFTLYMLPVMLVDNVLRPLVMAKGLKTPIPVIFCGVIGGTLAHGMIGLFVGPIVLSIAWQLLAVWMRDDTEEMPATP